MCLKSYVFIFERRTSKGAAAEQEGEQQFSYLPQPLPSSAKEHIGFLLTLLNVRGSPQITWRCSDLGFFHWNINFLSWMSWNRCAFVVSVGFYHSTNSCEEESRSFRGGYAKDSFFQMFQQLLLKIGSLEILAFAFFSQIAEPAALYCPG